MEKIIEIKNRVIELILAQKMLSTLIALIVVMLISTIYISATQVDTKKPSNNLSLNIKSTTSQPANISKPKEIISPAAATITPRKTNPTTALSPAKPAIKQSPAANPTRVTNLPGSNPTIQPTNALSTPGSSGQTQPTTPANPTIYPTPVGNPTSVPSSGPQIVFINPDGESEVYTPPDTPPVEITWATYTNQLEHYAIDYPSNWQIVTTQYMLHEAVLIYAPGADPGDPDVQYISYGWSSYFYPPQASYVGSFTLDGVQGTIYTNGSIGTSFIAGVFNYANGFLVLNNNVSDEIFAYVFNHMILSLDFNTP